MKKRSSPRNALGFLGVCVAALCATGQARANGAFPDSGQLLLPPLRPNEITLGTNFGLLGTDDGGATWYWTCESTNATLGRLYQQLPSGRILGISNSGLITTDDGGCSWQVAGTPGEGAIALDAFPDRADPEHILVTTADPESGFARSVHESFDGGRTFGAALFSVEPDEILTGVEIARSDSNIVLISSYRYSLDDPTVLRPRLARSTNSGRDWTVLDLYPQVGDAKPAIIAIDPSDPDTIFLRLRNTAIGDRLAVSHDAGRTVTTPVHVAGNLSAFLQREQGDLLVAGIEQQAGVAFRSLDGGKTFEPWTVALRLRALAERDGTVYAAADNFVDGIALVRMTDDGATWDPLLKFSDVVGMKECVRESCQSNCFFNSMFGLWPADVCGPTATTPTLPPDTSVDPEPPSATPTVATASSNGCRFTPAKANSLGDLAAAISLAGLVASSLGRRRGRAR